MPFRVPPSRVAAALDFIGRLRDRAGGILNTVASTPGTLRPDEYQERFGLPGDPVPAPREVGRTVRGAATRFTSLDAPQNPTFAEMAAETGASFVPGVGQLLAARDIERARRADDPAGMAMAASNFLPVDRLIGALRHGLGRPPISELDVYHGTPHTYAPTEANPLGEFDASKIGAGEGAQAYGHGIYLAESPSVAKSYRLAGSDAQHKRLTGGMTPMEEAAFDLASQGTKGEDLFSAMYQRYGKNLQTDQDFDAFQAAIRNAESSSGNLLKADLPDEMIDRMLDWDKPLSEQRELATPILKELGYLRPNENGPRQFTQAVKALSLEHGGFGESGATGMGLFKAIYKGLEQGNPKAIDLAKRMNLGEQGMFMEAAPLASEVMKRMGIPGIKYLDAGSRGQGGSGTRNFVVFPGEEKKVRILERNGQPAPERIAQALEAAPTTARRPTALPTIKPGDVVDGYKVRPDIPNQSSIAASLNNYEVLPGIRSINMTEFDPQYVRSISPDKLDSRTRKLMDEISQSKELNPLIVAYDSKGPYIIEGGHRFDALAASKAKSVPAMVVIDMDDPPR